MTLSPFAGPLIASLFLLVPACSPSPSAAGDEQDPENAAAETEQAEAAEEQRLERVRVEPVVVDSIEKALDAVANVQSLDVVDVVPERSEPVLEVMVEEGDRVEVGQVLARLRDRVALLALRDTEVRVEEARNEADRAKRDYERNKQLAERPDGQGTSLLSERELETSLQAMLAAQTAYESAKVALDQAQLDVDRCILKAPIRGTIAARDISVGDQTTIGQRAFQIVDLEHPRVVFYRPQGEIGSLRVGQRMIATAEAYPDLEIEGTIERVAPTVDQESGTVKVTAILSPPENLTLPTGLLVRLRVVLEQHPNAILVPKRALIYEEDAVVCFAIRDQRAVRVEVQPGFENPTHLEHLGDGLQAGDLVATVGQDRLEDGEEVEVLDE